MFLDSPWEILAQYTYVELYKYFKNWWSKIENVWLWTKLELQPLWNGGTKCSFVRSFLSRIWSFFSLSCVWTGYLRRHCIPVITIVCLEITCLPFFQVWPVYWYLWYGLLRRSGAGWLPCRSPAQVQVTRWHPAQGDQRRCHEVVPGEVRRSHTQQGPSKHLVIIDSRQMSCP